MYKNKHFDRENHSNQGVFEVQIKDSANSFVEFLRHKLLFTFKLCIYN